MAGKIKLGIIADAGSVTGFSTVTHSVARYLNSTGDYDIQILGINFHGKPNKWSREFNIWPAHLGGDSLGVGLVPQFLEEVNPDVLFLFQDFWNIALYLGAIGKPRSGMVAYYPVDAPNIKGTYILPMAACAEVACYTQFGVDQSVRAAKEAWQNIREMAAVQKRDVLETMEVQVGRAKDTVNDGAEGRIRVNARRIQQLKQPDSYNVIPHGIDLSTFKPIDKAEARKILNLPTDAFIVGNVNRNQSRKRLDLSVRAFAEFAKDKPNTYLLLHTVKADSQGWDLFQLADFYGIKTKVLLTHLLFQEAVASEEQLNALYNCLDVQINTGGGEGWGLTSYEGAACKVPQVVPNWSATKEIWEGSGKLIDVTSIRHEPFLINTMQAVIDTNHLVTILNEFYSDSTLRETIGEACFKVTQRPEYTWQSVGKQFDKMFKKALGKLPVGGPVGINTSGIIALKKQGAK